MAVGSVFRRLAWPSCWTGGSDRRDRRGDDIRDHRGPRWWWWVLIGAGLALAVCTWWGFHLRTAATNESAIDRNKLYPESETPRCSTPTTVPSPHGTSAAT
jgi:hypothetical protein